MKEYFVEPKYYTDKNKKLKSSIELGPMGYFLRDADKTKLESFIESKYESIDISSIQKIGKVLITPISGRWNHAAHTQSLNTTTVVEDKEIVFADDNEYGKQKKTRDMINKVPRLVFS